MYNYAYILDTGDGNPVNKKEASQYYKMAAKKKEIKLQLSITLEFYYNGDGIPANKKEADIYFNELSDKGDEHSMFKYALMLDKGDEILLNKREAIQYRKDF